MSKAILTLNKFQGSYLLSLEFCTFSILGHAFSSICQANVAWIGIVPTYIQEDLEVMHQNYRLWIVFIARFQGRKGEVLTIF